MRALRFAAMLAVIGAATPPETFRYVYEAPRRRVPAPVMSKVRDREGQHDRRRARQTRKKRRGF